MVRWVGVGKVDKDEKAAWSQIVAGLEKESNRLGTFYHAQGRVIEL